MKNPKAIERSKQIMSKDQIIADAVKSALAGGRTFGQKQHKDAISHILGTLKADSTPADLGAIRDAVCELANLSAFQQRLEKNGLIDRAKKIGNDALMAMLSAEEPAKPTAPPAKPK